MTKLYLMLGYPGAGKTTTARIIHKLTGAVHLWADHMRNERYKNPTHSHEENLEFYGYLNEVAAELLASKQSVIFDAAFNSYDDRQRLRKIAEQHGVDTVVVWVNTGKGLAKDRATHEIHSKNNRYSSPMQVERFEQLSGKLEEPHPDENVIAIDGTKVADDYIAEKLGLR